MVQDRGGVACSNKGRQTVRGRGVGAQGDAEGKGRSSRYNLVPEDSRALGGQQTPEQRASPGSRLPHKPLGLPKAEKGWTQCSPPGCSWSGPRPTPAEPRSPGRLKHRKAPLGTAIYKHTCSLIPGTRGCYLARGVLQV